MESPKVLSPILVKITSEVRMATEAEGVIPRVVINSWQVGSARQTVTSGDVIPPSEAAQICWIKRKGGREKERGSRLNMCQSAAKWFQLGISDWI